jgi:hypothetical protein
MIPKVVTNEKLGASRGVIENGTWEWPLHGLRHPPEADTTGWFLWTGELQTDADFFQPWHVAHAIDRCPELQSFLQLPPGSRFIYAPNYSDVWEDDSLLDI